MISTLAYYNIDLLMAVKKCRVQFLKVMRLFIVPKLIIYAPKHMTSMSKKMRSPFLANLAESRLSKMKEALLPAIAYANELGYERGLQFPQDSLLD